MSKKPVSISIEAYDAVAQYAEANDLTITAAADFIMRRGLVGLPVTHPATSPAGEGEAQRGTSQETMLAANLSRF